MKNALIGLTVMLGVGIAVGAWSDSIGFGLTGACIAILLLPSKYDPAIIWKESRQRYMAWYVGPDQVKRYLCTDYSLSTYWYPTTSNAVKFISQDDARAYLPTEDGHPHIAGRVGVEIIS